MQGKGIAKLKEQARTHEQREEWDAAISVYLQVLRAGEEEEVADLPLYNRVGDLYLRTGRPADAVNYYEQAADHYADAGLHNNAIALCNKALRYAPHRVDLLRKLGRFSASQGFLSDARRWFLEYAERAFHKGDVDDAFSALDDFADISNNAEIRELLARKMYAHERLDDALHEYRRAFAMRLRDGAIDEAEALKKEALERYPDLTDLDPEGTEEAAREATSADVLPQLDDEPSAADAPKPPAGLPGLPGLDDVPAAADAESGTLAGFETTSLASEGETEAPAAPQTTPDLEPTHADVAEPVPAGNGAQESALGTPDHEVPATATAEPAPDEATTASDDYVDLSELLGVTEAKANETRFFVQETDPTGDEDRDFAELLSQFKQKIAENVAHDDIGSHYDLGLAFKEMGLLDEAISEFQVALRAGDDRLKIFEELGQCFLLKRQFNIAVKVLSRALQFEPDDEIELIGVYYHLGRAFEEIEDRSRALDAYERVVGLDINFMDVADRIAGL
jgi:tetratricopeptide (TPR) repeat protein